MKWLVRYIDRDGTETKTSIEAVTKPDAIAASNLPRTRIVSVRRDFFFEIRKSLFQTRLKPFKQTTLMSAVSAVAISGRSPDPTIEKFIESERMIRKRKKEVMAIDGVAGKLRALNFDAQAVVLVETGEDSGQTGQALRRASEELMYRRKLLGKLKSALIMPSLIVIMSLASLITMPIYFVPILKSFTGSGLKITMTFATKAMIVISNVATTFWPHMLVAAVLILWQRKRVWNAVSPYGPFAAIDEYFKSIRALAFLTLFRPLYERGVEVARIMTIQSENTTGSTRRVYEYLLDEIRRGNSLADSLSEKHWPTHMIQGFLGFDEANPKAKQEILTQLQSLIANRVSDLSDLITGFLTFLGIVLGAMTAVMLALGIYYPIFSASPGT